MGRKGEELGQKLVHSLAQCESATVFRERYW